MTVDSIMFWNEPNNKSHWDFEIDSDWKMFGDMVKLAAHEVRLVPWHLALAGAFIGFLTGVVASTGPITVPVFLAYGLVKGAFIATEAAASLAVYAAKVVVFRSFGALPLDVIAKGAITGSTLMAGAFIARRFVLTMPAERFRHLMDGVLLLSGVALLALALRG